MNRLFYLIIVLLLVSCGTQKQLQKAYVGKSLAVITQKFGEPKTILDRENEKVYIFEVLKNLEGTEVNQGKLALDPIITPKVKKTERYYFTVKDGKVIDTKLEEEYER